MNERPLYSKAFGLTLWLTARGYEPLGVEVAKDGTGNLIYIFSPAARSGPDITEFYAMKECLNQMGLDARNLHNRNQNQPPAGDKNHGRQPASHHST